MKKTFLLILSALALAACNRNDDDATKVGSTGTEFFPVKTGSTFIYQVDSIAYDDNGPQAIDTFSYQYKEEVAESFVDDAGKTAYIIHRSFRQHDSDTWVSAKNYTAQFLNNTVQRVEENIRLVKLVFPIKDRLSWDGNMYNNQGYQSYKILNFKRPYQLNNTTVSSIKVQQWDVENFIEEIKRYEVYGENIGMVELLFDSLNTQDSGTRGFRYHLKLTSYTQ